MMKRIQALLLIFSCFVGSFIYASDKPNFIFILTDDQQYGLMGCDGNEAIKTPHLDKLSEDGVFFNNAHITSAICTPSRISILLSQYERKHGVNFNSGTSVAPEAWAQSYPVILKENGYYTGYVGKNHAPIGEGGYNSGLMEKSFDYWYAGHGHLTFYPKNRHAIFKQAENNTQIEIIQEGINDFMSNEHKMEGALHFIDERPKDKPFCLNICFNLPHGASTGTMKMLDNDPEMYKSLYRDKELSLPENYVAKEDIEIPKLPENILFANERQSEYDYVNEPKTLIERKIRQMQAMTGIDKLVGGLRNQLAEQGLDKNTIIIFTSDHGLLMGEYGLGGKALCYEKTTHVPFMVYNPKTDKKARSRSLDNLVQTIDIAPTILDYAGIAIPETFQGHSIKALIEGKQQIVREYVFTENLWSTQFGNPRCEAVQDKEWKYIRYYKNNNLRASEKIKTAEILNLHKGQMLYATHDPDIAMYRSFIEGPLEGEQPVYEELYNLKNDPGELINLINDDSHAEVLKRMRTAWQKHIKIARGVGNPKVLRYTKDSMLEQNKKLQLN